MATPECGVQGMPTVGKQLPRAQVVGYTYGNIDVDLKLQAFVASSLPQYCCMCSQQLKLCCADATLLIMVHVRDIAMSC